MKRVISLVLCILLLVTVFAGCNTNSEPSITVPAYERGTVTGNSWSSQWLDLSCMLDAGFVFYTEEQINDLMQITAEHIMVDSNGKSVVDYSKIDAVYEMYAQHSGGKNVIVMCENNAKLKLTESAYIAAMKLQVAQTGLDYTFSEMKETTVGGLKMYRVDSVAHLYGAKVYQSYFLKVYGDRMVSIILSSPIEADIDLMLGYFK